MVELYYHSTCAVLPEMMRLHPGLLSALVVLAVDPCSGGCCLCASSPRGLSRADVRARQRAVRDLSHAMVQLSIPGNAASEYAELLAERGVRGASELGSLSAGLMDACRMRRAHRDLLRASSVLAAADELSLSSLSPELLQPPLRVAEGGSDAGSGPSRRKADATEASRDERVADDTADEVLQEPSPPPCVERAYLLDRDRDRPPLPHPVQEVHEITLPAELDGSRLDAALAASLPPLSRTYFSSLCADGRVTVDGAKVLGQSAEHPALKPQPWL